MDRKLHAGHLVLIYGVVAMVLLAWQIVNGGMVAACQFNGDACASKGVVAARIALLWPAYLVRALMT